MTDQPTPLDRTAPVTPAATVRPTTIDELAATLRTADNGGRAVRIGRRTSMSADAISLSLDKLERPIDHCAGDLVASVPAGATLAAVNAVLAKGGQWLPLDPADAAGTTIGAIVATNDSGPRRHRYGSPRDLIIGVEMVLANGRVAKSGGRVVKNVAGYDLSRLMCGSRGCLAILTSATFKLYPLPSASCTVVADVRDVPSLGVLAAAIAAAPLTPTAIELAVPPCRLIVRFETTPTAAAAQAAAAVTVCERLGAHAAVVDGTREHEIWISHHHVVALARGTELKVSVLPADVTSILDVLTQAASTHHIQWRATGRAALGVLDVELQDPTDRHAAVVADLRGAVARRHGSVVVTKGDGPAGEHWGSMGDAWPLMRAIKARFDPNNTLNPGCGPGGL